MIPNNSLAVILVLGTTQTLGWASSSPARRGQSWFAALRRCAQRLARTRLCQSLSGPEPSRSQTLSNPQPIQALACMSCCPKAFGRKLPSGAVKNDPDNRGISRTLLRTSSHDSHLSLCRCSGSVPRYNLVGRLAHRRTMFHSRHHGFLTSCLCRLALPSVGVSRSSGGRFKPVTPFGTVMISVLASRNEPHHRPQKK
jgi:hypothetical protein